MASRPDGGRHLYEPAMVPQSLPSMLSGVPFIDGRDADAVGSASTDINPMGAGAGGFAALLAASPVPAPPAAGPTVTENDQPAEAVTTPPAVAVPAPLPPVMAVAADAPTPAPAPAPAPDPVTVLPATVATTPIDVNARPINDGGGATDTPPLPTPQPRPTPAPAIVQDKALVDGDTSPALASPSPSPLAVDPDRDVQDTPSPERLRIDGGSTDGKIAPLPVSRDVPPVAENPELSDAAPMPSLPKQGGIVVGDAQVAPVSPTETPQKPISLPPVSRQAVEGPPPALGRGIHGRVAARAEYTDDAIAVKEPQKTGNIPPISAVESAPIASAPVISDAAQIDASLNLTPATAERNGGTIAPVRNLLAMPDKTADLFNGTTVAANDRPSRIADDDTVPTSLPSELDLAPAAPKPIADRVQPNPAPQPALDQVASALAIAPTPEPTPSPNGKWAKDQVARNTEITLPAPKLDGSKPKLSQPIPEASASPTRGDAPVEPAGMTQETAQAAGLDRADAPAPAPNGEATGGDRQQPAPAQHLVQAHAQRAELAANSFTVTPPPAPSSPYALARVQAIGADVGVAIVRHANSAAGDLLVIHMDPIELGRIEIRLNVDAQRQLTAEVSAEQRATLDLLRRDVDSLTRALSDAGFNAEDQRLTFDQRGSGASYQQDQQPRRSKFHSYTVINDVAPDPITPPPRSTDRIDLVA